MFGKCLGTFWNILQDIGSTMFFEVSELLVISLTVNICIAIYAGTLRLQKNCIGKCCCKNENWFIILCRTFQNKQYILSKFVTEQFTAWVLSAAGVGALFTSGVIYRPFDGTFPEPYAQFIPILLSINIGRYFYMLVQDLYILHLIEASKYRTDTIHHVVAFVCYCVFLVFKQNYLLAIIGITMELSTTIIEISKITKELGKTKTRFYQRLTLISCISTITFRGVVPVTFLIIAMFLQTPFTMHYTVLTIFFLSIIFFSVINVWLILTTIQRLVKSFCNKSSLFRRTESSSHVPTFQDSTASNDYQFFTKNNLGYMRRYDNKNLCYVEEEKLNTTKKMTAKDNIPTAGFPVNMHQARSLEDIDSNETSVESQNNSSDNSVPAASNSYIVRFERERSSDRSSSSGRALISETSHSAASASSSQETGAVNV
ncbi:hypothetical protein FSP39_017371 [Pinctada imbricata]|uniref:TLC domain-containing protein n=1 Tax=Pinctada imbricata TaxID=66713 RepID=A0AA88XZL9_PINIB|nr:hypothetical protein FSP39_017371 [Pinctada imbricata]